MCTHHPLHCAHWHRFCHRGIEIWSRPFSVQAVVRFSGPCSWFPSLLIQVCSLLLQPEDEHPGTCSPSQRAAVGRDGPEDRRERRVHRGESLKGAQTGRLQQPRTLPHRLPHESLHAAAELRRYEHASSRHPDVDIWFGAFRIRTAASSLSRLLFACLSEGGALAEPALEDRGFPAEILLEEMIPTLKLVIRAVRSAPSHRPVTVQASCWSTVTGM